MTYETAKRILGDMGQGHVLAFWDGLNPVQRSALLAQIGDLDVDGVARMREMLGRRQAAVAAPAGPLVPAEVVTLTGEARRAAFAAGELALRAREVGVILVAGGQGSRLGFEGPKGCYSIAPISGATLFAIHARKILALERAYDTQIPFYVMTSDTNDAETRRFFEAHSFFGLTPGRVHFFMQGMWPALWPDGRIVMDAPDHVFASPDGHGGVLRALRMNGMLDDMSRRGLRTLFYFQVDNPLVDIADPAFIGIHRQRQAEVSVKVCAKRDPDEGLGVVVRRGDRNAVVEYTELTADQKRETGPDGRLRLLFGSVAIHVFDLEFLKREAVANLPLHMAHKKVPFCDEKGRIVKPAQPNAYKFEKFIFDVIPDATRTVNLEFDRAEEFSPVKNAEGNDSPHTCRRDMVRKFDRWLGACGVVVPRGSDGEPAVRIEIDPCYALDPAMLKARLPKDFTLHGDALLV